MEINVTRNDNNVSLSLLGRLDTASAPPLQQKVDELTLSDEPLNVTIDFAGVDFVSSAGLRVLLIFLKKTNKAGGSLVLINLSESIKEVFDMTGFSGILNIK